MSSELPIAAYSSELKQRFTRTYLFDLDLLNASQVDTSLTAHGSIEACVQFDRYCAGLLRPGAEIDTQRFIQIVEDLKIFERSAPGIHPVRRFLIFYWYFKINDIAIEQDATIAGWFTEVIPKLNLPLLPGAVALSKDNKKAINEILRGDVEILPTVINNIDRNLIDSYLNDAQQLRFELLEKLHANLELQNPDFHEISQILYQLISNVDATQSVFNYDKIDVMLVQGLAIREEAPHWDSYCLAKLPKSEKLLCEKQEIVRQRIAEKRHKELKNNLLQSYPWDNLISWLKHEESEVFSLEHKQEPKAYLGNLYRLGQTLSGLDELRKSEPGFRINFNLLLILSAVHKQRKTNDLAEFVSLLETPLEESDSFQKHLKIQKDKYAYQSIIDSLYDNPRKTDCKAYPELELAKKLLVNKFLNTEELAFSDDEWLEIPETVRSKIINRFEVLFSTDVLKLDSKKFNDFWFVLPVCLQSSKIEKLNILAKSVIAYQEYNAKISELINMTLSCDIDPEKLLEQFTRHRVLIDLLESIADPCDSSWLELAIELYFRLIENPGSLMVIDLLDRVSQPEFNNDAFEYCKNHIPSELVPLYDYLNFLFHNVDCERAHIISVCEQILPMETVGKEISKKWLNQSEGFFREFVSTEENSGNLALLLKFSRKINLDLGIDNHPPAIANAGSEFKEVTEDIQYYYRGWSDGEGHIIDTISHLWPLRAKLSNDELEVYSYYSSGLLEDLRKFFDEIEKVFAHIPTAKEWFEGEVIDRDEGRGLLSQLTRFLDQLESWRRLFDVHKDKLQRMELAVSLDCWVNQQLPRIRTHKQMFQNFHQELEKKSVNKFSDNSVFDQQIINFAKLGAIQVYQQIFSAEALEGFAELNGHLSNIVPKLNKQQRLLAQRQEILILGLNQFDRQLLSKFSHNEEQLSEIDEQLASPMKELLNIVA